MKTYDSRDKLRLVKQFFIFNMLQQPSYFININKITKKKSTTEFIPPIQEEVVENNSESMIPICDKFSMAKFLVTLKLLQRPCYHKNINKPFKNDPINNKHEEKVTQNNLSLIKNIKNKLDENFMLFIRQVTFEYDSESINKKSEINTSTDAIYETCENENDDYFESSLPTEPIIIEEADIDI